MIDLDAMRAKDDLAQADKEELCDVIENLRHKVENLRSLLNASQSALHDTISDRSIADARADAYREVIVLSTKGSRA